MGQKITASHSALTDCCYFRKDILFLNGVHCIRVGVIWFYYLQKTLTATRCHPAPPDSSRS